MNWSIYKLEEKYLQEVNVYHKEFLNGDLQPRYGKGHRSWLHSLCGHFLCKKKSIGQ